MILEMIIGLITVFSLAITTISALAHRRTGSRKILVVTAAFALFFIKGLILSIGVLQGNTDWELMILYSTLLDFIVMALLFAAIIVRNK